MFRHAPTRFLRRSLQLLLACGAALLSPAFGAAASTAPSEAVDYTRTTYPIVLVHGLFGFDDEGPVDYFFGIGDGLRKGGATVFVPTLSSTDSNEVRGEELLRYLQSLQAAYGYTKFNLIGHSQGGPTSRYVAAVAPGLVASVTSVGSPHQGSPVADGVKGLTSFTGTTGVVGLIGTALGKAITGFDGSPQLQEHALAALQANSTAGAADFNARFPQGSPTTPCGVGPGNVNGVRYESFGGTAVLTNPADPSDAVLLATSAFFAGEPNDGLVGRCSNHWGTVLRDDYPWNHLDEINQVFGLRSLLAPDPIAVYRAQANRLKRAGL